MKNTPAYILTDNSITIVVDGKPYTMSQSNAAFGVVKERIASENFDGIEKLFDTGAAVGAFTQGNVVVKNNSVLYKGEPVDNHVVDRILDFMRQGLPYKPLVNFLDKLMANPSHRAVQELYRFLEHKNMPLTPDGNFLAYKSVRQDWTDHHTGTFTNTIGSVLEMVRHNVCDDANIGCSYGFHAGSLEYAKSFGGSEARLLIVEINPSDVVSIPHDSNCQKLRTSKYKVVGTFERPLDEALNTQYCDGNWECNCGNNNDNNIVEDDDSAEDDEQADCEEMGYESGYEDGLSGGVSDSEAALLVAVGDGLPNEQFDAVDYLSGYEEGYRDGIVVRGNALSLKKDSRKTNGTGAPRKKVKAVKKSNAKNRDARGRFC